MNSGKIDFDLHFVRESAPVFPPPPELGPEAYTRLITAAWSHRTEEDWQRCLMDERNRPVGAWFHLDGQKKDKR